MENCTKVMDVKTIEESFFLKEGITRFDCSYQLKTNSAFIFELKSGEIVLIPNHMHDEDLGIIFKDKACFQYYLEKDQFPIESTINDKIFNFYEQEIEFITKIPGNLQSVQEEINKLTGLSYSELDRNVIANYYQVLAKRSKAKKILDENYLNLVLLVGEVLRKEKNAKWAFIKRYGLYNPYYEPIIIDGSGNIFQVALQFASFLELGSKDLLSFFSRGRIKNPFLTVEHFEKNTIVFP